MILKYKYFPEQKLFVDYLEGEVNLDILRKFHSEERKFARNNEVRKVLSNINNVKFRIKTSEIPSYIKELKKTSKENDNRWAILSTATIPTALSYVIKDVPFFSKKVQIFSTIEAAVDYLDIDFEVSEFESDGFTYFKP